MLEDASLAAGPCLVFTLFDYVKTMLGCHNSAQLSISIIPDPINPYFNVSTDPLEQLFLQELW